MCIDSFKGLACRRGPLGFVGTGGGGGMWQKKYEASGRLIYLAAVKRAVRVVCILVAGLSNHPPFLFRPL